MDKYILLKWKAETLTINKMKLALLFITVAFILGCRHEHLKSEPIKINAYLVRGDENKTDLNIKIQTILPLETDGSNLIGNISKLEKYRNNYYIFDEYVSKALFCFNQKGHLLFKTKIGKGPGELIGPTDFSIDSIKQEICVYDDIRFVFLDLKGNFLRNEKNPERLYTQKCEILKNKYILVYNSAPAPSDFTEANKDKTIDLQMRFRTYVLYDKYSKLEIGKFLPTTRKNSRIILEKPISVFNNNIYCLSGDASNLIYKFTEDNQMIAAYDINFGNKTITEKDREKGAPYIFDLIRKGQRVGNLDNLFVTDDFLIFGYLSNIEKTQCIYSLTTKKIYLLAKVLEFNSLPKAKPLKFIDSDILICSIDAIDYNEFVKEKGHETTCNLNLKVSNNDNPILITVKILQSVK